MRILIILALLGAAAESGGADLRSAQTSLQNQTDVALTAYNNGLGLVRDTRAVMLPSGEVQLTFSDVAQKIRPETVGLRSVSAPGSVAILEQNYEYDLMSPAKLMEKYVGRQVKLVNFDKRLGFQEQTAELLSINDGPIYRTNGQVYLGYPGTVVLPQVPANLIAKPSLIWTITNSAPNQRLELTYLTRGISWKADYVLRLAKDEKALDLTGWVTMNNQSGATYTNAQLKLVAGDVNVAPEERLKTLGYDINGDGVVAAMVMMPKEEAFGEYHLYTVPRRTTIKNNESKQIMLLQATRVTCAKRYEFRDQASFYRRRLKPIENRSVGVYLEFENKKDNHLGLPLPAGIMRIYQEDSEGMLQFTGEDHIEHTPKDEKISLHMGEAFDIVASRVQKDFRRIASNITESSYEISVRNHKDRSVVVDVVEPMPGDWTILKKSQNYVKKDAHTAVFKVPVKSNSEAKVTYTARVTY